MKQKKRKAEDTYTCKQRMKYLQAKLKTGKCLLIRRAYDFCILEFEDAEWAHENLGLTLTTLSTRDGRLSIPMAGYPINQHESVIQRVSAMGVAVVVTGGEE